MLLHLSPQVLTSSLWIRKSSFFQKKFIFQTHTQFKSEYLDDSLSIGIKMVESNDRQVNIKKCAS